jgi:hypothetical protein
MHAFKTQCALIYYKLKKNSLLILLIEFTHINTYVKKYETILMEKISLVLFYFNKI